jgi:hypothetical protein
VLQDKLKNSKILASSLLQAKLLFEYFVDLQDASHFFVEVKTFPKDRCIHIFNNYMDIPDIEEFPLINFYRLVWVKFGFTICLLFSELFLMPDELRGYAIDSKLRTMFRDVVKKVLDYAELKYPQGCYIKIVFPDTGLCSIFTDEAVGRVYLEGIVVVTVSPIEFIVE